MRTLFRCPSLIAFAALMAGVFGAPGKSFAIETLTTAAKTQIQALMDEKETRTPAQQKMDSQLVYFVKQQQNNLALLAVPNLAVDVKVAPNNKVLVDIRAVVTPELLAFITEAGGGIVSQVPVFSSIRALVPVTFVEALAGREDVRFVEPAAMATTNIGSILSEAPRTHRATTARTTLGADGTGIKIGVLSDGVNSLSKSKANGNLTTTARALAAQSGSGDEGTAMMELIQDMLPGAQLTFATAFNGAASFANNILGLQAAGCTVIVDDVSYFNESPFQDMVISQAVNTVSSAGVMYFSSARNSGNKNDGTSGTWEGDFADGGAATAPVTTTGNLLDFGGGVTFNTVVAGGSQYRVDFFWSDPLGASANDYDLFILDSTGATVLRSSTNIQNGTQDPYEATSTLIAGERIVIVKKTGAANRFLHLDTGRGRLTINTAGNVRGHNASGAANAFSVAATNVANSPNPNFFTGGGTNPVETFSSDGPRRIFYQPNGTPITAGNFSATGGLVLNKPDITAADGSATSVIGFTSFFGTSAAAPHAAAIAAMLKSYNPSLTPAQIRTLMTSTALDIEAAGFDRDSGSGIVMALQSLQAAPAPDVLTIAETGLDASGSFGGPFSPASGTYTLTNTSGSPVNWTAASTQSWNTVSPTSGTLAAGGNVTVTCTIAAAANALSIGSYNDTVTITNTGSGFSRKLSVNLNVQPYTGAGVGNIVDGTSATPPAFGTPLVVSFPVSGLATNVTNVSINMSLFHTAAGDLDMVLAAPGGSPSLVLASRIGATTAAAVGSTSDYSGSYTFSDFTSGANIWTAAGAASPIPNGVYRTTGAGGAGQTNPPPVTSLVTTFGGLTPAQANGTWTLTIRDATLTNTGSIVSATLTVDTGALPSSNANLSNLVPSTGTLSPAFASGTTTYGLGVPNGTSTIAFTPTLADAGATVEFAYNSISTGTVASGSPSPNLPLNVGNNTIQAAVTAASGATKTYTIIVNRANTVAQLVIPSSAAGTSGLNTPIRLAARTLQTVYSSAYMAGIPIGSTITGLSFRLFANETTWPATTRNWTSYDVQLSKSVNAPGSLSTTFANNIGTDVVTVRSGAFSVAPNTYVGSSSIAPFGPTITFTTPYTYTGGDLLLTIRHTGNGVDDRFCDVVADAAGFQQTLTSTAGFTATTGANQGSSLIMQLTYALASTTVNSLNIVNPSPTAASSVNWTLTFGAATTGVTASNFTLSGAAAVGATVGTPTTVDSGLTWNVPVNTGPNPGTLTLNFDNATSLTKAISTSLPFVGQSYTMTRTLPGITPSTASLLATATGVIINGTNFDTTASNNTVVFDNGAVGTVTASTATQLTVTFSVKPASAGPLNATVTNTLGTSATTQVATVMPVITSSTANLAGNATTLTINGFGFSPTPGNNVIAFSPTGTGTVTASTPTSLTVTSLASLSTGALNAIVTSNGQASATAQVATVLALPVAVTLTTTSVNANATTLTITGTGFNAGTPSNNTVVFSPFGTGIVTAATTTSLTVTSVTGLRAGVLSAVVTNTNGNSGAAVQVAAVKPVITSSTISIPITATTFTINGFGFDLTAGNNTVTFSPLGTGTVTASTATSLTVTSVSGLAAGALSATVTSNSQAGASTQVATVVNGTPTVTPTITSVNANATSLTITGTGFNAVTPSNNTVVFSPVGTGTVTAATATSLTVSVTGLRAGVLNAVVTNSTGNSGIAVQVATVKPVVTTTTTSITAAATTLTIGGAGFDLTAGNNTVAFSPTGTGTVTVATATLLTIGSVTGLTTGNLSAIVTSNGQASASTQVATVGIAPTITTPTKVAVVGNPVVYQLGGNVTVSGGSLTERGIVFSISATNADPLIGGAGVTKVAQGTTSGVFRIPTPTLLPTTAYSYKAYATNPNGTVYTTVDTFTTGVAPTPGGFYNFMEATNVIGQADFVSVSSATSQATTPNAADCAVSVTGKLAVASQSGIVLIWNRVPTTNGQPADVVVGRPNFTSTSSGTTASLMSNCNGVCFSPDGTKLIVSDFNSNRILIWNTVPTVNGAAADVVIGQTDFVSSTGGSSATKLSGPAGVMVTPGGKLLVAEFNNNRILVYNSVPTVNGAAADLVIGQPDMTTNTSGNAANKMFNPWHCALTSDGKLLVSDQTNNRVLVFNSLPTVNGASADVVIGQTGFGLSSAGVGVANMFTPIGVAVSPTGQLTVGEFGSSRVLLYNSVPTVNGAAADVVLGQPDFSSLTASNGGVSSHSMANVYQPTFTPDNRLLVAMRGTNRVMVFGSAPPPPTVTSSSATLLANATTLTITGTNFSTTAASNTVTFSPTGTGTVTAATATSLTVTVSGLRAGALNAVVNTFGQSSGAAVQVATVVPVVSSSVTSFPANAGTLTLNGFGFDPTAANNTVAFSPSGTGTVTASTPTTLTVTGISGLTAGALSAVVNSNGQASAAAQVATVAPAITPSITGVASNATSVTITGAGFALVPGNNTVVFSPTGSGTVTASTATTLTVTSVTGLTLGALNAVVTSNGQTSASAQVGTVTAGVILTVTAVTANADAAAGVAAASWESIRSGMVLASSGAVAFRGHLAIVGGVTVDDFQGIWKSTDGSIGTTSLVARSGVTAVPGVAGGLFDVLPVNPIINNSVQTSFVGYLRVNVGGVTGTSDTGVWTELGTGGLKLALREGDSVGGDTLGAIAPSGWIGGGSNALACSVRLSPSGTAIVRADVAGATVTPSLVAKQGTAAPVLSGGTAGNFDNLAGNYSDPRMDNAGNVAFSATLGSGGVGIWYRTAAGALGAVANDGEAAPSLGGPTFITFERPSLSGDGSTIAFRAFVTGANSQTVFKGAPSNPAGLVAIASSNDTAIPGIPSGSKLWSLWSPFTNNTGKVAFRVSMLDGVGAETRAIITDTDGTLKVIAKVGDVAPGLGAETFVNFDHPIIGDGNQAAFIAATSAGTVGLFRQAAGGGALALVAMVGDFVTVAGGGTKMITSMTIPGTTTADRKYEAKTMDAAGHILIHVGYDGINTGIILTAP